MGATDGRVGVEAMRFSRVLAAAAVAVAASQLFVAPGTAAAETARPSFFGSEEVRSDNLKPFAKWTNAIARYEEEKVKAAKTQGNCSSAQFNRCHYEQWVKFLVGLKDKDKLTQVQEVNAFMNRAKYVTDDVNWGEKDYWETPGEFIAKLGDCEDYAIAKFMSLRLLGFSDDALRVVAVKDLNLNVGHAILVVFLDGKVYVLDNQIKQVVEAARIRHYQPVFSINATSWWRHRT